MTELHIPELSLVALVVISGAGKSTFAARHFGRFEVVSSDFCRGLVADDENDQTAGEDAFDVLGYIVGKRLARGRLTVVDATNVSRSARAQIVGLAKEHDVLPVAIVLDVPEKVAVARNQDRPDRDFGSHVQRRQARLLHQSLRGLAREGFRQVHVLRTPEEIDAATIVRDRLHNDLRDETGPFDVIGDVHGCLLELLDLLGRLGHQITADAQGRPIDARHPGGRRVIFLGDLVDRGPDTPGVLRLAMGMTASGHALAVMGNHEAKLQRALAGRDVQRSHGLAETLTQLDAEPPEFRDRVCEWLDGLVAHYVLDGGHLVVAHAGLKEAYHGRASGRVRSFALYGDTTAETDEYRLPVRYPWAEDYRGLATVLYGHTPTPSLTWINNTLCLDTGCVFGGRLSALRYPEREPVQVDAARIWYEPAKPLVGATTRGDDELTVLDVLGVRGVETATHGRVTVSSEHAAGAFDAMTRSALHPRWLAYLPPTMAPVDASTLDDYLEYPDRAFAWFARGGVGDVVCEEKHMGSRAVVAVCLDEAAAARRFGATDGETGAVYSRTGRAFFDRDLTEEFLGRVRVAVSASGLWSELESDWLLLDAELLPWSLKASGLIAEQFAPLGAASGLMLPAAVRALDAASERGLDVADLLARTRTRDDNAGRFRAVLASYAWPTDGLDGIQVAPFQVLASNGQTHEGRPHDWHLAVADRLVAADPDLFRTTRRLLVATGDAGSVADAERWWLDLTGAGGEGMVVKPAANLIMKGRTPVQPGLKVRGREYLRIIYGPDYTDASGLARLKDRNLGHKRSAALREYALGLESLTRFVAGEPLWRVHEAVFAVMALEAEPMDPRL